MHNFVFHNPTKVLFGRGTLAALGSETLAWGRKALLVHGQGSLKRNGLHGQIMDNLRESGIEVIEHGGVRSNPLLSHAREGVAKAKAAKVEVIVAAGGGSVIDTAKAVGAGAVVEHDLWKFFTGKRGIKGTLPVLTVPTVAASGSEMNSGMVLTNDQTREKFGFGHRLLHPKVSFLDPTTTFTLPPDHTAFGAIDALNHVLEFYLTTTGANTPVQDRLMEGLIENAMTACTRCLAVPHDYDARSDLMWTAALALSGLTAAGLGRVGFPMHLIEHSLSALFDVPHGAGLAVVMLGWLRVHRKDCAPRIAQLGRRVLALTEPADRKATDQTLARLEQWLRSVGAPTTLDQLGISAADIPALSENTRGLARIWRLREYSPEKVAVILQACL
ncbi:iron-containing alcohol dehydrogenase [Desulfobulbus propionicus]